MSIGALADGVSVTSQTMTRVIDRMEASELCYREPDPEDRRAWLVFLAPSGDEILSKALPAHYVWVAQLMSHFDDDERLMLKRLMLKINQANALCV